MIKEHIQAIEKQLMQNENYQTLKSLPEDMLEIKYHYAASLYEDNNTNEAIKEFFQLILAKPFSQKYWFGLASSYQLEKKYQEALDAWAICSFLDDNDPYAHFHAAECLFMQKQFTEAKKAIIEAKKTCQDDILTNQISHFENRWLQND